MQRIGCLVLQPYAATDVAHARHHIWTIIGDKEYM